ncbi:MAG: DUF92 domain-containing protein [Bacteroidetes bacterium]|nr:MAG: DUF92 domain-containing protein [Bacteroidota bacterium]
MAVAYSYPETFTMTQLKGLIIRKLIHLFTGLLIFILTFLLQREVLLWLIVGGSLFSFLTFNYKKFHLLHKTTDASLGTLFYPLGILSSYLILYNMPILYFQTSLLVLAVSDTLANFIGQIKKGNGKVVILHDKKSMHGIMGYVFSAIIIFYIFLPARLTTDVFFMATLVFLAVVFEVVSWRGSDNFTIPVGLAILLKVSQTQQPDFLFLFGVLLFMTAGSVLLYKWRFLTRFGSFSAWLLGVYLLGVMGWKWFVPVVLFFITSVVFTKIHSGVKKKKKESNGRNAWQVTANILWAVISSALFLITQNEIFIYFFIAFVAAVTADTWASEIGPLFNKRSFSLADFRTHEAGITGGISFFGTFAAITGAFFISSISYVLFFGEWNWAIILLLSFSAFLACFADTLLGTFVEDKLLEMSYFKNRIYPEALTPNDVVNLGGSFTAFAFFLLLGFVF